MKKIDNPLTVVGLFAGIAEIAGTTVLPLVSEPIQNVFIWYVMGFPILLVVLFFITLNFNPKVLYSPSDFTDEKNFMALLTHMTQKVDDAINASPEIEEQIKPVEIALEQVAMQASSKNIDVVFEPAIISYNDSYETKRTSHFDAKKAFLILSGKKVNLDKEEVSIGRRADIVVNDPTVSGIHCMILKHDDSFYIIDCGASNGTSVNGQVVSHNSSVLLHNKDIIRIGTTTFRFYDGN